MLLRLLNWIIPTLHHFSFVGVFHSKGESVYIYTLTVMVCFTNSIWLNKDQLSRNKMRFDKNKGG